MGGGPGKEGRRDRGRGRIGGSREKKRDKTHVTTASLASSSALGPYRPFVVKSS